MAPHGLRRIRLFVRDATRMREFYERVLGFPLVAATSDSARFDAGGVEIVLQADPPFADSEYRDFINQLKGNMRGMGTAFHFDVEDVDAYFHALRAKGVVPIEPEKNRSLDAPIDRGGRREFAIEDPEGYWLFFGTPSNHPGVIAMTAQRATGQVWFGSRWRRFAMGCTILAVIMFVNLALVATENLGRPEFYVVLLLASYLFAYGVYTLYPRQSKGRG